MQYYKQISIDDINPEINNDTPIYKSQRKKVSVLHFCPRVRIASRRWGTWMKVGDKCPLCGQEIKK